MRRPSCLPWAETLLALLVISGVSPLAEAHAVEVLPSELRPSVASRQIAAQGMQRARALRWAQADRQLFAAPLPPLTTGVNPRLILNSRFAGTNVVEVAITSRAGELRVLTNEELAPRRTVEIDLLELMAGTRAGFRPAAVRVSFFGDKEMIQAWLLLSGPGGFTEVPLQNRNEQSGSRWTSFWDTRLYGRTPEPQLTYVFHNTETTPVVVSGELIGLGAAGGSRRFDQEIRPTGTFVLRPPRGAHLSAGQLKAHHDGTPGQVLAAGYLVGPRFLATLPVVGPAELVQSRVYDSPSLPLGADRSARPVISLLNTAGEGSEPAFFEISLIDLVSGREVAAIEDRLASAEIRSIDLFREAPGTFDGLARDLRLQVSFHGGGPVLPYCLALAPGGEPTEIALIPRHKVHDSGTYPIPSLEEHRVATTFVNLGDAPTQVFAHLAWERGEYALAPIQIAPGAAYRLEFNKLLELRQPDLKGRLFQPGGSSAHFQWLSRRGSSDLIARTEVRPLGESDSWGFNCFGCCEEWPYGGMEPEFAAFRVGATGDFETVEFVDTCAGTMGPYHAWPVSSVYSSPLGWNYYDVWATGETNQMVNFSGEGDYMWIDCNTRHRTFFGDGPVVADETCQQQHHPEFDPSKGCCGMHGTNVTACKECCDKEKEVADCRCDKLPLGFRGICKGLADFVSLTKCHNPCAAGCGN